MVEFKWRLYRFGINLFRLGAVQRRNPTSVKADPLERSWPLIHT